MKTASVGTLLIALGMVMASGCALLSPEKVAVQKEILNKIPHQIPEAQAHAATLLILTPDTQPIYDTTQMAYTIRPYEVAYFRQHEWGEKPAQMIQTLLVQTFQNTHYFSAILMPPYLAGYTYALRSEILDLKQDYTSDPPMLRLAMRFRLSDGATHQVIASREIAVHEPMQEKTPYAGVIAANDAIAKVLQEVAKFVLEKVD
jgi:cholesterol transport system auxiliary component